MPLEGLFEDKKTMVSPTDRRQTLYEFCGVLGNPFPSAGQTSGHPHFSTQADQTVDSEIVSFYTDKKSHVLAITATQGIGKTNLLNAYETALQEKLGNLGFFVIRYVADPDRFFDRLIVSIFEYLGEHHLRSSIEVLATKPIKERQEVIDKIRTSEVREMFRSLLRKSLDNHSDEEERYTLAQQWLLGLPVRKAHRDMLNVNFRMDTVEAKTRALRDVVYVSHQIGTLQGVFLLLDELEKGDVSSSKTELLRYLQAMRALIDALPEYLFLMVALTPDALNRYREMQPALKGRLANEVRLLPLQSEAEAVALYQFYLHHAQNEAADIGKNKQWKSGRNSILTSETAVSVFRTLLPRKTVEGVRQRDYLNQLHDKANEKIELLLR